MPTLLRPETAAKLASTLFPESDTETSLINLLEWFNEYETNRKLITGSYSKGTTMRKLEPTQEKLNSWSRNPEPEGEERTTKGELPLDTGAGGIRNNPQIKQMMHDLLVHARQNKLSASDLAQQVGASYPTILNWQRGKLPRGENIDKVRIFLSKINK